jgi:hypothetical protein
LTLRAAGGDLEALGSPKDDTKSGAGDPQQPPATGPDRERPRARSIPPPIPPPIPPRLPGDERRKRTTLVPPVPRAPAPRPDGVESPSVVDRALARLAQVNDAARAEQLARDLAGAVRSDPPGAANLAYELGERYERSATRTARSRRIAGRSSSIRRWRRLRGHCAGCCTAALSGTSSRR